VVKGQEHVVATVAEADLVTSRGGGGLAAPALDIDQPVDLLAAVDGSRVLQFAAPLPVAAHRDLTRLLADNGLGGHTPPVALWRDLATSTRGETMVTLAGRFTSGWADLTTVSAALTDPAAGGRVDDVDPLRRTTHRQVASFRHPGDGWQPTSLAGCTISELNSGRTKLAHPSPIGQRARGGSPMRRIAATSISGTRDSGAVLSGEIRPFSNAAAFPGCTDQIAPRAEIPCTIRLADDETDVAHLATAGLRDVHRNRGSGSLGGEHDSAGRLRIVSGLVKKSSSAAEDVRDASDQGSGKRPAERGGSPGGPRVGQLGMPVSALAELDDG
jgi:hypothetical protein